MYRLIYRFRQVGFDKPIEKEKLIEDDVAMKLEEAKRNKESVKITGVGLIPHTDILQIQEMNGRDNSSSSGKSLLHIVQYIHSDISEIPNLQKGGHKVERVNYNKKREPIYTQIAFLPRELYDKKTDSEKEHWIEQEIRNDQIRKS